MDLTQVGLNMGIVLAIIAITKVLTATLDPKGFLGRWYILVPTILAIVAAFVVTRPITWQEVAMNALLYVGTSTYLYKFGKTTVLDQ